MAKVAGAERHLAEIYARVLAPLSGDDEASARVGPTHGARSSPTSARSIRRSSTCGARSRLRARGRRTVRRRRRLLERAQRHEERVELYRTALDHRYEAAARTRLLHIHR
jgi:hypothetical protein